MKSDTWFPVGHDRFRPRADLTRSVPPSLQQHRLHSCPVVVGAHGSKQIPCAGCNRRQWFYPKALGYRFTRRNTTELQIAKNKAFTLIVCHPRQNRPSAVHYLGLSKKS